MVGIKYNCSDATAN